MLKHPQQIKRKTKRQSKKVNYGTFTSDEVSEIYEKELEEKKNKEKEKEWKKKICEKQKIIQ